MTVADWQEPAGVTAANDLLRISPGAVGDEAYACPEFVAAKVRPRVQPLSRPRWPKPTLQGFALKPIVAALDAVEFRGVQPSIALGNVRRSKQAIHRGLFEFTRVALTNYLDAAQRATGPSLVLDAVPHYWVVARAAPAGRLWEMYAWGRRYQSSDRRYREFRFLRFGTATSAGPGSNGSDDDGRDRREAGRDTGRDVVQVAIAAYVAAFGCAASWPESWLAPFELRGRVEVERVRVAEVGLADGSYAVHFEGSPAEAKRFYDEHAQQAVAGLVAGGTARPGSSCVDCKLITACAALPRAPGLLGLPTMKGPLREVSASTLRYHKVCPAQAHLRSLKLPKTYEYSPEAERGQAVHAFLEQRHRDPSRRPCDAEVLRVDRAGWSAGSWVLAGEQAVAGAEMLAQHEYVCPFHSAGVEEVRVEPRLAFFDTAVNTVILAKPDLLYREDGSWVWREVKTSAPRPGKEPGSGLGMGVPSVETSEQIALAVLILAGGYLGGEVSGSRVELEVLRPDGPDMVYTDPSDPDVVATARRLIGERARHWLEDQAYPAHPGRECRRCPVSRWCPDGASGVVDDRGNDHR